MAVNAIRALLFGNDLSISSLEHSSAQAIEIQVSRSLSLADTVRQVHREAFDVILVNPSLSEEEELDTIRDLHEQMSWLPILLINDSNEPGFIAKAVQHGAQDVIPLSATCEDAFQRLLLTSIERKRSEQHRIRHARTDELTGLGNRLLLEERFGRAMARADRHETLVALVAIELDQPEELSERRCIDHLLPLIGKRLAREIRQTDTLARTRNAGLTWLVEDLASISDVDVLVGRLPELLSTSFCPDGREVLVTASVGVAVSPFHGRDFKTLLDLAEAAMLDVANLSGDGLLMPPLPPAIEKARSGAFI